uniref:Uncharacterized protein n=1 Tax=Rhizophora mucronata TaxID=61149 RepID=A0A2P2PB93_RHIMU
MRLLPSLGAVVHMFVDVLLDLAFSFAESIRMSIYVMKLLGIE